MKNVPLIVALVVSVVIAIIFVVLFLTKKTKCPPTKCPPTKCPPTKCPPPKCPPTDCQPQVDLALNKAKKIYGYKGPDGARYFGADQRVFGTARADATYGTGKQKTTFEVPIPRNNYVFLENNRVIKSDMGFCDKGKYGGTCEFKMCPWDHQEIYNFATANSDCGTGLRCDPDAGKCVQRCPEAKCGSGLQCDKPTGKCILKK